MTPRGRPTPAQECIRCGESNIVERQSGLPTVSKERVAELKMFVPLNSDDTA